MKRVLTLLMVWAVSGWTAPAFNATHDFTQPDGTIFTGVMQGDEWMNWIALPKGYVALYNQRTKGYEYAVVTTQGNVPRLAPSGVRVSGNDGPKQAPARNGAVIRPIDRNTLVKMWKRARSAARSYR